MTLATRPPLTIHQAAELTTAQLARLPKREQRRLFDEWLVWQLADAKANQLDYYRPVNADARRFHRSTARERALQGGRKCQVAGSRVVTGRGLIPIEEVKLGDEILGVHQRAGVVTETHTWDDAVPVFRLHTRRGYTLTGNAEHPVWTTPPSRPGWHRSVYAEGPGQETPLSAVRPGDFVAIRFGGVFPEHGEITADDGYFLGVMTGDGSWCAPYGVMKFTSADEPLLVWLEAYLAGRGIATRRYAKAGTVAMSLEWCNLPFKRMVAAWGVVLGTSGHKQVPESVWRGPRAVVRAFLRGYADTDGGVGLKPELVLGTISEQLASGVHQLLLRFGVVSSRRLRVHANGYRSWEVQVTGRNLRRYAAEIGCGLPRKAARLPSGFAAPGPRWDRVISVEPAGRARVYGLTVFPHHRYLADGFLNGNSGKTATMLAEFAIQATGVIPASLRTDYPRQTLRPPIRARLVVTSLVNAWDANLKLKLQWWEWNGALNADGLPGDPDRGHWGLIPQRFLLGGDWDKSWSEKHRTLTLNRGGDGGTIPGSTLQVLSHETDLKDLNQGSYHLIIEDEIPPEEMHRANRLRTLEVDGQILTGGTPTDEAGGAVASAWFFDQLLAPGLEGSNPAEVFAVALWTEQNPTLPAATLETIGRGLTPEQRRASFHGESLHLSGLIYPGFREKPGWWCLRCHGAVARVDGACAACAVEGLTSGLLPFCHVWDDGDVPAEALRRWPVLFYMDPHQSRPTACAWYAVDPMDQWWQVDELELAGSAEQVKAACLALEAARGYDVVWRKGDPKITAQTNQFAREVQGEIFSIKKAFDEVGFFFEEANTNFTVGRERLLGALAVNPITKAPRFRLHRRCAKSIWQLGHFTWSTPRRALADLAPKEQPSRRNSDFPATARYLALDDPEYRQVRQTQAPVVLHVGAGLRGRGVTGW